MSHILSKSTYLKGVQCEKALYLNKYHKELKDELTEAQKAIFSQGTEVGELAQDLFPGGIDVTPETFFDYSRSIEQTRDAIKEGKRVIYEAAFQHEGVLCAVDILVRNEDSWEAYEVKSSTLVKDTHIEDASLQYYVLGQCGIQLKDISIVVLNNKYIREGALDIHRLFKIQSVIDKVHVLQSDVKKNIDQFKQVLSSSQVPNELIGVKCTEPYTCNFQGHCWKNVPEYSVFNLSRIKKKEAEALYHRGVSLITDIPYDHKLTRSQIHQVQCERDGSVIINKRELREFTGSLQYPLYFLDFETTQMAVPAFDQQKPYQQIPFQYSLHLQDKPEKKYLHLEVLADTNGGDPRMKFIKNLIWDCGSEGTILVYNKSFEKRILNELIKDFPAYEDQLQSIIERMVDLMEPFQKKYYYTPQMQGSYSIKKVLPALCPELSYDELEIQEGGSASRIFAQMLSKEFDGDVLQTRTALCEYCKLDTWAMVKILDKIHDVI